MELSTLYRECTLNRISESDIGKELKVAGWVENIRDHGGVSFIDLRDMYGVLQIVMRNTDLLKGINKEDCVTITGEIEKRDEETYNPKIPTGTIELEAHSIEILGKVYKPLPFEIATSKEIREDLRLKYRYLDLRNRKVLDNMIFRSNVIKFLREKMTEMGFMEIQTPILCASSPEGARDYIVPSRHYKGKFYALPQAPQQYKQLLKVAAHEGCNYFTFNIPNTVCNDCGHIDKRYLKECPHCHSKNLDYLTRIIGYMKRVSNFSKARQEEASRRFYAKDHGEIKQACEACEA